MNIIDEVGRLRNALGKNGKWEKKGNKFLIPWM